MTRQSEDALYLLFAYWETGVAWLLGGMERKKEREELEKEYGKPISLHPEFGPGRYKCYTPEFKDRSHVWGVSHLYPYGDFPDFSGDSIVELED